MSLINAFVYSSLNDLHLYTPMQNHCSSSLGWIQFFFQLWLRDFLTDYLPNTEVCLQLQSGEMSVIHNFHDSP